MDIKKLQEEVVKFRDAREWKQFNNPKDMAIYLSLEAAELLELFQWRNGKELETYISENKKAIGEELSDVLYNTLLLAHDLEIDISQAFLDKLKKNEQKYPIAKFKGKHNKK